MHKKAAAQTRKLSYDHLCDFGGRSVMSTVSLDIYFLRQLIVAELFFAVGFTILLALVGFCFLLGVVGERGWTLMKQEAQKHSAHSRAELRARSLEPSTANRHSAT